MSQWGTPHPKLFFGQSRDPTVNDDVDDGACPGSLWIDSMNDNAFVCIVADRGTAVWLSIAGSGSLSYSYDFSYSYNSMYEVLGVW